MHGCHAAFPELSEDSMVVFPLQLAVNAFADLTAEEFRATHLGMRPGSNATVR